MNEKQKKMILDWMRKIHQLEYAHRFESVMWAKLETWIGLSAFILSIVVAFSYGFPFLNDSNANLPFFLKLGFLVPFLSLIVSMLTGMQTFLKPNEKSETHKKTASNYEKLRHRIELLITTEYSERDLVKKLDSIREEWESLDSINVSSRNFDKGKQRTRALNKYPKELDFLDDLH